MWTWVLNLLQSPELRNAELALISALLGMLGVLFIRGTRWLGATTDRMEGSLAVIHRDTNAERSVLMAEIASLRTALDATKGVIIGPDEIVILHEEIKHLRHDLDLAKKALRDAEDFGYPPHHADMRGTR
jgi:hypothetical protein